MTTPKHEDPEKPRIRILRFPRTEDRTGLGKTAIMDLVAQGKFPQPVQISARAIGFYEHEVEAWIQDRPRVRKVRAQ